MKKGYGIKKEDWIRAYENAIEREKKNIQVSIELGFPENISRSLEKIREYEEKLKAL